MGRHPTGNCNTCKVKGDIEHLLLQCTENGIAVKLQEKCEIYKNEFNLKTLLEVGCYQNFVYNLVKVMNNGKIM